MKELNKAYEEYENFKDSLLHERRFFILEKYTKIFDDIINENEYSVRLNTILYRSRIHDNPKGEEVREPYKGKDIGMPSTDIIMSSGRINPKGINYFYLSGDSDTTVGEVRPNILDYVTIGTFKTSKELKVIKLNYETSIVDSKRERVSGHSSEFIMFFIIYLQQDFCKSVRDGDKELEYLTTQLFAEYCKSKGYDGIMFPSSIMKQNLTDHYNYVFFDSDKVKWSSSELIQVNEINYKYQCINSI